MATEAAGLGKITVLSALGQPLRAEVEVFATREEIAGMKAQLASPDEFKQAGVDYSSVLAGISFAVAKRPNGQAIIKLSSNRPINDPFVDLLLELNWATGRLIRDYTFLLDPPEFAARAAASAAPAVVARPVAPVRPVGEDRVAATKPARVEYYKARAKEQAEKPAEKTPAAAPGRQVRRGETLSQIARETRPEGVSLDQMLVGLFRANEDAFDRGNMNRLRAGKILSIPEKGTVEAIPRNEARQVVVAQSSDWGAYRRKLAAAATDSPAGEDAAKQQAAGKITTRVEEPAGPAAEAKDHLKVSKSELAPGKSAAMSKRSDEDLIAKEQALKEANERLASLEKSVAELQRLVELKSQSLAELERQAATGTAPAAAVAVPAAVATPVGAAKAVDKPADQPGGDKTMGTVAQVEQKAEDAKPEVKPEPPKPVEPPAPNKVVVPPPPPEESSFLTELFTSTPFLAGGGIAALLAAYWLAKRRRQGEGSLDETSTLAPHSENLVVNSVFRNTGGQSVNTAHSVAQTDFSQAGPGSIDTDEVDPVAEADVYMAYGRDAQAEEILLEAKQKDPGRHAIHLKLLEIYFSRRDVKPFDALATELFNATGGVGVEWEKTAAMGVQLDSRNALFGPAGQGEQGAPMTDEAATATIAAAGVPVIAPEMRVVEPTRSPVDFSEPMERTLIDPAARSRQARASGGGHEADETVDFEKTDLAGRNRDRDEDSQSGAPNDGDDPFLEATLSFPTPEQGGALDFDLETSLPKGSLLPVADEDESSETSEKSPLEVVSPPEETVLLELPSQATTSQLGAGLDFEFDLGVAVPGEPTESSAESRTKAPAPADDDEPVDIGSADAEALEFDVKLSESAVLGQAMQQPSVDLSSISLDLDDVDEISPAQPAADDTPEFSFETELEDTLVNPDFSTAQTDSTLDPHFGSDVDLAAGPEISSSEEVATKIDLAKAYQEMGDLEGARELLQEVLKDGDAAQQAAAQAILAGLRE
ncbi:FimV/HubP family polar landmark protein [Accumulibacter sp.]|uniref:FimV/HubP family polar landmark protein n=1 Tax=Accumulibacter sp. TaxID=2053492 RepID=UPI0028C4C6FE|nr:FimV/HubP family polar landmark protein [Accumulibacter sp.]